MQNKNIWIKIYKQYTSTLSDGQNPKTPVRKNLLQKCKLSTQSHSCGIKLQCEMHEMSHSWRQIYQTSQSMHDINTKQRYKIIQSDCRKKPQNPFAHYSPCRKRQRWPPRPATYRQCQCSPSGMPRSAAWFHTGTPNTTYEDTNGRPQQRSLSS